MYHHICITLSTIMACTWVLLLPWMCHIYTQIYHICLCMACPLYHCSTYRYYDRKIEVYLLTARTHIQKLHLVHLFYLWLYIYTSNKFCNLYFWGKFTYFRFSFYIYKTRHEILGTYIYRWREIPHQGDMVPFYIMCPSLPLPTFPKYIYIWL